MIKGRDSNRIRQVIYGSDERGITMLSVSVYSLLKTADSTKPLSIYVAHNQRFIEAGGRETVRQIVDRYPFATINFVNITPLGSEYPELFTTERRYGETVWVPLLCERLLSEDVVGNLVYIDIDMVILNDLDELYVMDLDAEGKVAAAVNESRRENVKYLQKFGWPEEAGYAINTGLMVINLNEFRRGHYGERLINWACRNPKAICPDQDAYNIVCGACIKRIHPKWNYTDGWLERVVKFNPFAKQWRVFPPREILEAVLSPNVIHYIGYRKPTSWTHRPERKRYHRLMKELGVYPANGKLPGETIPRKMVELVFDVYYLILRVYARLLYQIRK